MVDVELPKGYPYEVTTPLDTLVDDFLKMEKENAFKLKSPSKNKHPQKNPFKNIQSQLACNQKSPTQNPSKNKYDNQSFFMVYKTH